MRVKKKWNRTESERSIAQMANAIAGTIWKLAAGVLLNLENENFETETQGQRIDIMDELVAFLVHLVDRRIFAQATAEQRDEFISTLVKDLARMLEDSRIDVQGEGQYQAAFIEMVNERSAEYAAYSFSPEEGASFAMRCTLGNHVQASMGERDQRWIPDFVEGREAPQMEASLKRVMDGLISFES